MYGLYHHLDALAFYARSPLQHLAFEPRMNWWWISPSVSPSEQLWEQVKDTFHLLEQVGFIEKGETFYKVKLSIILEKRFGDKLSAFPFNKKLYVIVIGLSCKDPADCPMYATLLRDQGEEKNKKRLDLKKIIVCAAEKTLMQ
jgi:hypothetical protein